jgi:hypothetical protein
MYHRLPLTPSNLRDGVMASNPDISLECFQFHELKIAKTVS